MKKIIAIVLACMMIPGLMGGCIAAEQESGLTQQVNVPLHAAIQQEMDSPDCVVVIDTVENLNVAF